MYECMYVCMSVHLCISFFILITWICKITIILLSGHPGLRCLYSLWSHSKGMYVCMYVAGNWLLKEDSVGRRMPSRFHPNMSLEWEGNYRHTYIHTYVHTYIHLTCIHIYIQGVYWKLSEVRIHSNGSHFHDQWSDTHYYYTLSTHIHTCVKSIIAKTLLHKLSIYIHFVSIHTYIHTYIHT